VEEGRERTKDFSLKTNTAISHENLTSSLLNLFRKSQNVRLYTETRGFYFKHVVLMHVETVPSMKSSIREWGKIRLEEILGSHGCNLLGCCAV
jgi:transposase-like protein